MPSTETTGAGGNRREKPPGQGGRQGDDGSFAPGRRDPRLAVSSWTVLERDSENYESENRRSHKPKPERKRDDTRPERTSKALTFQTGQTSRGFQLVPIRTNLPVVAKRLPRFGAGIRFAPLFLEATVSYPQNARVIPRTLPTAKVLLHRANGDSTDPAGDSTDTTREGLGIFRGLYRHILITRFK